MFLLKTFFTWQFYFVKFSDETLMVKEIDAVGPGGQFLDTEETLNRFRDFWFPGLLDRKTRPRWLQAGATTLGQRLTRKVKKIIKEHRAPELPSEKKQKLDEILARVKKH